MDPTTGQPDSAPSRRGRRVGRRLHRAAPLALVTAVATVAVACSSGSSSTATTGTTPTTGSPRPPAVSTAAGLPPIRHVFVIVLENAGYASTFGTPAADPYLATDVSASGAQLSQYHGIGHFSNPNYIALVSGQAPNPTNQADCQVFADFAAAAAVGTGGQVSGSGCIFPSQVQTVAGQMDAAHLSWKAYMQDMGNIPNREPAVCAHPAIGAVDHTQEAVPGDGYATRHDPFVYYPPIVDNPARCASHVRPYSETATALSHDGAVPNFVFISPDTCHDGHDATCPGGKPGGLVSADAWLAANVPPILNSTAYKDNGALFITFDESLPTDLGGCCASGIFANGSNGGGRVGLLALSPLAKVGAVIHHAYDHNSLLRTIEDAFGIHEHLNNAGSPRTSAMTNLFLP